VRSAAIQLVGAVLVGLALVACETVVDVPPPDHDPKLVAQSFFSTDSLWVVRVTHTVPFTASIPPGVVDSATVEILRGNQVIAQPALSDSGTYVATGPGAREGESYTLRVDAPGFPSLEGTDTLPLSPPVTSTNVTAVPPSDRTSLRRIRQVDITIDDPPSPGQYYGVLVVQARAKVDRRTGQVSPLPPSLFPFETDDPAFGESELDFLDTEKARFREAFFPDDFFDGSTYTLDFQIQYDAPSPDASVAIRRAFAVVFFSVTEDFFRYWETANEQAITNENPFAEPLRVHSNLEGGPGVFAGFRYRIVPVDVGGWTPDSLGAGPFPLRDLCRIVGTRLPLCPSIPGR
jgi:hypothetical protein